jgi:hypothetical protein
MVMAIPILEMKIEPVIKTPLTTDEMVRTILAQIDTLEPRRKYMFMAWMHAHNSQMKNVTNLQEGLSVWFDSLPSENAQWEYRLIIKEVEWWSSQGDRKVDLLMMEHFSERRS